MGKEEKKHCLSLGDVIRVKTTWGLPPSGIYRVEQISQGSVLLSVGEVQCVGNLKDLDIVERRIAAPIDWLAAEIEVLEGMLAMCDCEDCRSKLIAKKSQQRR